MVDSPTYQVITVLPCDQVPEPGSASELQLVTSESEDGVMEDWDEEEEDDSDEDELPPTVAVNMNTLSRFGPSDLMLEKKNFLAPHLLRAVSRVTLSVTPRLPF